MATRYPKSKPNALNTRNVPPLPTSLHIPTQRATSDTTTRRVRGECLHKLSRNPPAQ